MQKNVLSLGLLALTAALSWPLQAQPTPAAAAANISHSHHGHATEVHNAALSTKAQLDAIRQDARKDFALTAQKLRAMAPAQMNEEDRQTWLRLARSAAVRTGDRAWLQALSAENDPFSPVYVNRIVLASGYLAEGNLAAARAELAHIDDLSQVNVRDQRRYWSVKARLAQLEGRVAEERIAIEKIMEELPHWPHKSCQACHDDPKHKEVLPKLDVRNFWFAQRFVELMRLQGDAHAVQQDASQKLANNPHDTDARLFLAHALQALGQQEHAQRLLQEIPWVAQPGDNGPTPRMMFAWP